MPLSWNGNEHITVGNTTLFASSGPALVVLNNELLMIYSGIGHDLWSGTTAGLSPAWASNDQIVIAPKNPQTRYRPSAVEANGVIHTVYVGVSGGNLWWSWYDGNWSGNVHLPFIDPGQAVPTTITRGDPQPALAVYNGHLHLLWHNFLPSFTDPNTGQVVPKRNDIWYSVLDVGLPFEVASWSPPTRVATDASYPSVVAFNDTLYLFCTNAPQPATVSLGGLRFATLSGGVFSALESSLIVGDQPQMHDGAIGVVVDQLVYLIYRAVLDNTIWYATMDTSEHFEGNIQIQLAASTPRTQSFVGAVQFNNHLYLAYHGAASNRMYFTYTS